MAEKNDGFDIVSYLMGKQAGGGGGGGGGGGVSVYTVTLINSASDESHYTFESYQPFGEAGAMLYTRNSIHEVDVWAGESLAVNFLALNGLVVILDDCFSGINSSISPVVTGDVVYSQEHGGFIVTGDGTITLESSNK